MTRNVMLSYKKSSMSALRSSAANLEGDWWIDDDCKWRPVYNDPHYETTSFIGLSLIDQDIALRYLNMARIKITSRTVHIRWDVKTVDLRTISDVLNFLEGTKTKTIILNFFFGGWITEKYINSQQAVYRILSLQNLKYTFPLETVFISTHDSEDNNRKTKLLRRGSDFLRTIKNGFDSVSDKQLADFLPHNLVFGKKNPDAPLTFSYIGSKSTSARVYGPNWSINSIDAISDKTLSERNQEYDRRVSAAYEDVLETGEPRLDHIRALMHFDQDEPVWVSYQRLLGKVTAPNGNESVFCLCDRTQYISTEHLPMPKSG